MKIKSLLLAAATFAFAIQGFSQGTINFANNSGTRLIDGATGANAAAGSYTVGLYYGSPGSSEGELTLAGTGSISPIAALAGIYTGGTVTIDGVTAGNPVVVQVRAWEPAFGSYEEQLAANSGWAGASDIITVTLGGGTTAPASLPNAGLTSFTTVPVPEPSTIAFGILGGIGAMVLLRRRK
jgi:hypothetical protein